jgi:hypothetical protein
MELLIMIKNILHKKYLYLKINFIIKILIALFMIYRFNSYRKYKIQFTELDRKVAFSAGLFLFTTTIFNQILDAYLKKISHKYTPKNMFNFY